MIKLNNGKLLISSNKILLLLKNGEYIDPSQNQERKKKSIKETFEIEYVIVPNWSLNIYTGYPLPILRGSSFDYYDKLNDIYAHMHTCACVSTQVHTDAHIFTLVCIHVHTYAHMCNHMQT